MTSPYRPLALALAALGLFTGLFALGGFTGWWTPADYEPAIGEVSRWCERVEGGILREPVNTLGNLGFVVSGLIMFAVLAQETVKATTSRSQPAAQSITNRFTGNQPTALAYAGATVFLGPGSMVMHGSHTFFGAWIDNVSMVAYILIPWMYNVVSMRPSTDNISRTLLTAYVFVLGLYAVTYWLFGTNNGIGMDLFGLSIALWIISEVLFRFWSPSMRWITGFVGFGVALTFGITPVDMVNDIGRFWWVVLFWLPGALSPSPPQARRTYTPWYWAGVSSFLIAFAIWNTGKAGHEWCEPDSLIQAHAIWHLLTAASTWCFFMFLRTETAAEPDKPNVRALSDSAN